MDVLASKREKMEMMAYVINSKTGKFRLIWRTSGDPEGEYRKGPVAYIDKISAEADAARIVAGMEAVVEVQIEAI